MLIPTDAFSAIEKASFVSGGAAAILALLTDTAMRERPVSTADGALGQTVTTDTAGPYACSVAPKRIGVERVEGGALRSVKGFTIALQSDADVQPQDRLIVNSENFEVLATDKGASNSFLLTADCVKVL